ncbi:hypothetical protein BJA01nite_19310 [Bradyrhizobium japonicum]|nr:hypothetical protein BJ6T_45900 [Bradyrhizobium japonicum USDA 6]GEC44289.1 hypothetical protein BJA01nite_19310 [Bradyrhizobium japonicum]
MPKDAKCLRAPYDRVFERLGSVPDVRSWRIVGMERPDINVIFCARALDATRRFRDEALYEALGSHTMAWLIGVPLGSAGGVIQTPRRSPWPMRRSPRASVGRFDAGCLRAAALRYLQIWRLPSHPR